MGRERLPRRILEWCPPGRGRKGRSGNLWTQEITTVMRERGIGDLDWVDRERWRKKINLLWAQKDVKTSRISVQINTIWNNY